MFCWQCLIKSVDVPVAAWIPSSRWTPSHIVPHLSPTCTLCRDHELFFKWTVVKNVLIKFWKTHNAYRAPVLSVVIFCMFHFWSLPLVKWKRPTPLRFWGGCCVRRCWVLFWLDWLRLVAWKCSGNGEYRWREIIWHNFAMSCLCTRHCFSPRSIACVIKSWYFMMLHWHQANLNQGYSIWRHFQPSNVFGMFLCHHKGGVGLPWFCRYLFWHI